VHRLAPMTWLDWVVLRVLGGPFRVKSWLVSEDAGHSPPGEAGALPSITPNFKRRSIRFRSENPRFVKVLSEAQKAICVGRISDQNYDIILN